jgi:RNA polymerase sigma-70 factor, ECF subfamily
MGSKEGQDALLVKRCLGGSEEAWNSFYTRFIGLVKTIVRRRLGSHGKELDDISQEVFTTLIGSLKGYDSMYPLPKFISMIAERTCIQEYRSMSAAKRDAPTDPLTHHDDTEEGLYVPVEKSDSQEEQLAKCELSELLKHAVRNLGEKCRDLIRLRYYEDMPYKEIAALYRSTENTLNVQVKRCLDDLKGKYSRLQLRAKPKKL